MHKLLSGLALAALMAATAQAKPEGGGGGGGKGHGGGNPHAVSAGGGGGQGNGRARGGGGREMRAAAPGGGGGGQMRAMRQERPRGPDRAQRQVQRPERQVQRAERQVQRNERQDMRRVERADRRVQQVQQREQRQVERRVEQVQRRDQRQAERAVRFDDRRNDRAVLRGANGNNPRLIESPARFSGRGRALVDGCPPGLAKKNNGCLPPGLAAKSGVNAATAFAAAAGTGLLANRLTPSWFGYDDYGSDYRYYDGYLLRTSGDSVLGFVPLLGGALAPGRPWLSSFQPMPISDYWSDYYDLGPVDRYRYYDDVLYQLNPGYAEIEDIVALMAGDRWAVGQPMPYGYEVYNVPYMYRTRYYDTSDHWYRYSDGYLYDIDPTTRLVLAVSQLLGGSPLPGQPWLASYRAEPIPAYWNDYYGLDRPDRYRYYDDVIYELDDGYDEVDAIVAVTAGDTWTVGSRMPYGYDIYNVPYSHRTRYYDTSDHWYRYSDGYIYDIDPTTQLVLAAVQLLA